MSNFPERAEALVKEIADKNPALVGLQEVSPLRTGPGLNPAPAITVAFDYLQILLDALNVRGRHYGVVAVATNFDAEVPGLFTTGLVDVRLTDREVILARVDP